MNRGASKTGAHTEIRVASEVTDPPKKATEETPMFSEFDKDHGAEADQARRIAEERDE